LIKRCNIIQTFKISLSYRSLQLLVILNFSIISLRFIEDTSLNRICYLTSTWFLPEFPEHSVDYTQAVAGLSQEMITKLKTAIELGRWENGDKLTSEQVESALQAVMLWEAKNLGNEQSEPFKVGKDGELYTGKGESHKLSSSSKYDEETIIVKNKV
jgi:uncharacterized protein